MLRYTDTKGRDCAYYDTTLLFPTNVFHPEGASFGVAVLDMSDPAKPVQTDLLSELPMASPARIAQPQREARADRGGVWQPGDPARAGRRSTTRARTAATRFSSRRGPSPGSGTRAVLPRTDAPSTQPARRCPAITAVDVTDPKNPHAIWQGNVDSHGMTISDDGNRAYIADPPRARC